jgi:hypothetical protein
MRRLIEPFLAWLVVLVLAGVAFHHLIDLVAEPSRAAPPQPAVPSLAAFLASAATVLFVLGLAVRLARAARGFWATTLHGRRRDTGRLGAAPRGAEHLVDEGPRTGRTRRSHR